MRKALQTGPFSIGLLGSLALIFTGLLSSCTSAPERDPKTIFRYNEFSGISSLDPAFARVQSNIWATHQIFNGLVEMDNDLNVVPSIAESWTVVDSGKTYEFDLRTDVFFHKHEAFGEDSTRTVTAHDFVYSLQRLADSRTAAPGAWVVKDVDTLYAVNDSTLRIELNQPFAPFLGLLTMKYCSVVPQEIIELGEFSSQPIGTGPFYLKVWADNEVMILRKNPLYFEGENGKQLPHLESVVISFIPDKQSSYMEFLSGRQDLISGLDASYKDDLLTSDGELQPKHANDFVLQKSPYLNTEYLAFYVPDPSEINKVLIRKAINLGFDKEPMMKYLRNGVGEPATGGMIPAGLPGYQSHIGFDYNPQLAAQLLAEAGYPNGVGLPAIPLYTTSNYLDLCEYIQGQLSSLGIVLKVEVLPPSTLREKKAAGGLSFFRASWIADYPDAENYLSLFYSSNAAPNGPNYTHFSNAIFDSLYVKSRTESDAKVREALYESLDSLVMSEAPVVPLYYDQVVRVFPKSIEGLEPNALNLLTLKHVQKK